MAIQKKHYDIERQGQIDFFDNYRIDYQGDASILVDNTDGVYHGNIMEFKLFQSTGPCRARQQFCTAFLNIPPPRYAKSRKNKLISARSRKKIAFSTLFRPFCLF